MNTCSGGDGIYTGLGTKLFMSVYDVRGDFPKYFRKEIQEVNWIKNLKVGDEKFDLKINKAFLREDIEFLKHLRTNELRNFEIELPNGYVIQFTAIFKQIEFELIERDTLIQGDLILEVTYSSLVRK